MRLKISFVCSVGIHVYLPPIILGIIVIFISVIRSSLIKEFISFAPPKRAISFIPCFLSEIKVFFHESSKKSSFSNSLLDELSTLLYLIIHLLIGLRKYFQLLLNFLLFEATIEIGWLFDIFTSSFLVRFLTR